MVDNAPQTPVVETPQLTPEQISQLVTDYYAAVRALDVERWSAKFAGVTMMEDPAGSPPALSREEATQRYQYVVMTFSEVNMVPQTILAAPGTNEAAVQWNADLRFKENGVLVEGLPGISFVRFSNDGLIVSYRAFWDTTRLGG